MPWKETCVMDERLRFLGEYLKKERSMSALCQEFGISRKTGYRFVHRYQLEGLWGYSINRGRLIITLMPSATIWSGRSLPCERDILAGGRASCEPG